MVGIKGLGGLLESQCEFKAWPFLLDSMGVAARPETLNRGG